MEINLKKHTLILSDIIPGLIRLCQGLGEIAVAGQSDTTLQIITKKDKSPQTKIDRILDREITQYLISLSNEIPILSEESEDPFPKKSYHYLWVVDPLDGTKNYIDGKENYTINIALLHKHQPILGVLHHPIHQITYWAYKGAGAWKHDSNGIVSRIYVSNFSIYDSGLNVLTSRSHLTEKEELWLKKMKFPIVTKMGSSIKYALLSEGKADIVLRFGPTKEWDTAAAHIILNEAGGEIYDFHTKKPLVYQKDNYLNSSFIAVGILDNTNEIL